MFHGSTMASPGAKNSLGHTHLHLKQMRLIIIWIAASALAAAVPNAAHGKILITIDKNKQRMSVVPDGQSVYNWPVSTGRNGYPTPSGTFTAFRMEADHHSVEWDNAPMPHSIFFTQMGHAIHGTFDNNILESPQVMDACASRVQNKGDAKGQ